MNVHVTTGRWRLGLALSSITTLLWGLLPIALKGLLDRMDAYTIIWYRLFISVTFLFAFIIYRHGIPSPMRLKFPLTWLLIISSIGLCGNYILYILGLDHLPPSAATIVIQLSSVFMLLGSLVFFKEKFSMRQWAGFILLLAGMILFFNNKIDDLFYRISNYTTGVLLITLAAASWAVYALTQKQLLNSYPSEKIMLFIYFSGVMLFLPFAEPSGLLQLDIIGLLLLIFCAFNTLIAYGCFAEALDHLEASRVVMVTATTPLVTVAGMKLCSAFYPGFLIPENLNALSIAGAFLVVAGSIMSSLKRGNKGT